MQIKILLTTSYTAIFSYLFDIYLVQTRNRKWLGTNDITLVTTITIKTIVLSQINKTINFQNMSFI